MNTLINFEPVKSFQKTGNMWEFRRSGDSTSRSVWRKLKDIKFKCRRIEKKRVAVIKSIMKMEIVVESAVLYSRQPRIRLLSLNEMCYREHNYGMQTINRHMRKKDNIRITSRSNGTNSNIRRNMNGFRNFSRWANEKKFSFRRIQWEKIRYHTGRHFI